MRFFYLLIIYGCCQTCVAQDSIYVRQTIDHLCSPTFWGRGYTNEGMQKAASFVETELKSFGLQPLGKEFKQIFSYPVNTFPGKAVLTIDGKELKPGIDFIVNPASRGLVADDLDLEQQDSVNYLNAANRLLLTLTDKLTFSVAKEQADFTQILVNKSALSSVPKKISLNLESVFVPAFEAANVCAVLQGREQSDSLLVLSAHYDHLGGLGKQTYFPGANDNASGVAFLLSLAKYYAKNPPKHTIVFLFFAGEEAGLVGSQYFVAHPLIPLAKIKLLFNFDLVGTGDNGATVVNATTYPKPFQVLQQINTQKQYLKKINLRGKAANSDHYPFSERGVPAFFLYTQGGISAYHDVLDQPKTLPLTSYTKLFKLIRDFNVAIMN